MVPFILVTGIVSALYLAKRNAHYYHGSEKPLKKGTVLIAKKRPTEFSKRRSIDGVRLEKFVADNRPNGSLKREEAIFTVSDRKDLNAAGASEKYVYEVESLGKTQNVHFSWLTRLFSRSHDYEIGKSKLAKQLARNYYNKPKGTRATFFGSEENLHEAVKIKRRVK
jgi:hypothetical protein